MKRILVTGGAGFIGSHLVRRLLKKGHPVVNLDRLTYAASPQTVKELNASPHHHFFRGDIADGKLVRRLLKGVDGVVHCAAETHVDRSLLDAAEFLRTNVQGTWVMAEESRRAGVKRFVHVSTDEVYGDVPRGRTLETAPLKPSNPYAASKAGSDHLVLALSRTYGFPAMITRCTNNYGPYQHPEKFLPLFIIRALEGQPLPLYGRGLNQRRWIHVEDHCAALEIVLKRGRPGEIYNVAGHEDWRNIDVARRIIALTEADSALLRFVEDRPGHDTRYAPDDQKIRRELSWRPRHHFGEDLPSLVQWYRAHQTWWRPILSQKKGFAHYVQRQYGERISK